MEKSVIAELRALRIKRGISQAELSATLGRYPGFLSKIERNVASPQFRTLCMIASALGAEIRLMPKKKE
jgi:transcriptional regulator with XRE-family HTH domain